MYVKIHDSIFGSSIMEEDIETRYIWLCLLTIADGEGFIDETIPALARRFNVSESIMAKAINIFMQPDPTSRTSDHDGRRIEPIRETFGWRIINYTKYKAIRNYEDRKEYMKTYMRNYRESQENKKDGKQNVNTNANCKQRKLCKPNQNQNKNKNNIKERNIKERKDAISVLAYLNEVSGKKFTPTEANLKNIIARLKEGHTEEECKQVIDTKSRDPDFQEKYFRPVTLFRASKFEGYLNERPKKRWDEA